MIFSRSKEELAARAHSRSQYMLTPSQHQRVDQRMKKNRVREFHAAKKREAVLTQILGASRPLLYFGLAVLVAAIPILAYRAILHVASTPHFSVRSVEVNGASRVDRERILEVGGVAAGMQIVDLDDEEIEGRLMSTSEFRSVDVRMELPDHVVINVRERKAAAVFAAGDLYLVDEDGRTIKKLKTSEVPDLPVISMSGLETLDERDMKSLGAAQLLAEATALIAAYRKQEYSKFYPVEEVNIDPVDGFRIVALDGNVSFLMGHSPFSVKWERLDLILRDLSKRDARVESVSFDLTARPDEVIVSAKGLSSPGRRNPAVGQEMRPELLP